MTREMDAGQVNPSQTRVHWEINPEVRQQIVEAREAIEGARKEFENTPRSCPEHGKPSMFDRYEGAYTRGWAVFKCPNGHEFRYG